MLKLTLLNYYRIHINKERDMKRFEQFIFVVMVSLILSSCTKNEEEMDVVNPPQQTVSQEESRYYIKYEVDSSSKNVFSSYVYEQTIRFTTDKETEQIVLKGERGYTWDATYGPFKKGDKVSLFVSEAINNHARIYASIDKEPFVIKAEDSQNNSPINLSYTIDF